jgi:hypothetical protein
MNWIFENKEWLFSGIGVVIIGWVIHSFYQKKDASTIPTPIENNPSQKNEINIVNNVNTPIEDNHITPISSSSTKEELEKRKKLTNILFIDNDTKFKIVEILKVAGWINTEIIDDIENPDSHIVNISHILFIDINDVGIKMQFKDVGLGLANYLKNKYPKKKVIIYSTETAGNRFHPALRKVDTFLPKNAEPFEFQEIIEQYSAELDLK